MDHLNINSKLPIRATPFQWPTRLAQALLLALVIASFATSAAAQGGGERKRVLLLFTHDAHLLSQGVIEQAMYSALQNGSPVPIETYSEYLDAVRTNLDKYEPEVVRHLQLKYAGKKFDLIFAINPPALKLLLKNRSALCPGTPIVFMALDQSSVADLNLGPNVTGVWGETDYKSNLELALALHPGTKHVVLISGLSEWDNYWLARVQEEFRAYEGKVEFLNLIGLSIPEQQKALAGLPPQTIVFFISSVQDKAGNLYSNLEVLSKIAPASSAPMYGASDAHLGLGIVGGNLMSLEALGTTGAQTGLRVLAGEKPEAIAPHGIPSVVMFDWRQLKRWGISESSLPPGSIVRYRVPSFWEEYKWYAITGISVFIIQSGLIVGLVANRLRRKRAERALRRSEQKNRDIVRALPDLIFVHTADGICLDYHASDKHELLAGTDEYVGKNMREVLPGDLAEAFFGCFRRAKETGKLQVHEYRLPVYGEPRSFEARIIYTDNDQFLSIVRNVTKRKAAEAALRETQESLTIALDASRMGTWNLDLTSDFSGHRSLRHDQIFGYDTPQADWGRDIARRHIVEEDREVFDAAFTRALATGELEFEARVRWPDESIHWMAARGRFYFDENGQPTRGAGVNYDITHRKQAEEALRESEERFRNMADTAPVMIWVTGRDKLCTYVNQQWLNFTGRTVEQELGNGWASAIHPDDCERCLEIYGSAFDLREPFTMEYRLRRADGEFRWVLDSGAPRLSPGEEFLGYIGTALDISERKAAEEALEGLSGQLIRARENECARIARELHDDLNQRMALISIELEQMGQNLPSEDGRLHKQLRGILTQAAEVSREIHQISHDLHPSKLTHLGLGAALRSLCKDLMNSHGLKIEFFAEGVPAGLSAEISLCLYRIAQECLNNVIKHSGAQEATVQLRGTGNEIRLRVSDSGAGFDIESSNVWKGLGLVSMKERLRLVGGHVAISSRLSQGTQVDARVPLRRISLDYEPPSPDGKKRAARG